MLRRNSSGRPGRAAALVVASGLAFASALAGAAPAQEAVAPLSVEESLAEVRVQVGEAVDAIAAYSAARRAAAVADARKALRDLDTAIFALQRAARQDWEEKTQAVRDETDARLAELQTALINMAERVGTLQSGADAAWDELTSGVVSAWLVLSAAIEAVLDVTGRKG